MSKSSYHLVHYRLNQRTGWSATTPTFEQLCRNALSRKNEAGLPLWENASARIYSFLAPEERQILLNKVADLNTAVFGELCLVQAKDLQAIVGMTTSKQQLSDITTAEVYDLSEKEAPKGSQFLRGLLYWLAVGDHIFFVKMNGMSSELMQDYFNWLLTPTGPQAVSTVVSLKAQFDPSLGDIGEVRSLKVSGKSAPSISIVPDDNLPATTLRETSRKIKEAVREAAMAIPVVRAIYGDAHTESLLKSLGKDEYLTVDSTLKVRGKRTEESRKQIRELANALDDMSDTDVRIEGKDGTIKDGDAILRTRMPFSVPHEGSNILDFYNVADQLQIVYGRFVEDGKIKS